MPNAECSRQAASRFLEARLAILVDRLRGPGPEELVRTALDDVMQVQAVRVSAAGDAVGFLEELELPAPLAARLRPLALELFDRHRRRIVDIRAREASRSGFVASRARERRAAGGAGGGAR